MTTQNRTESVDFNKIAISDFEKVKNFEVTWIEISEKLKQQNYHYYFVKLLENEAEKLGINKEVHVAMSLNSLELSSKQAKSRLSPYKLLEIYDDINKRNPAFNIDVPDDIYYKKIALEDFDKLKNSKITWIEVAEKLNNELYKEHYVNLLKREAYDNKIDENYYVNTSLENIQNSLSQTVKSLSRDQLFELYNDIISRNTQFDIKMPAKAMSKHDKLNIELESIEQSNNTYIEAREDLKKHLNNKITDLEIAEKLNNNLEYKTAFTRYLEKDFYDNKRIGFNEKSYAEERIHSINLSLLYSQKKLNNNEGLFSQEKAEEIDSNDWIEKQKNILKSNNQNEKELNSTLNILNRMQASPQQNGDVIYSIENVDSFVDRGQSIQFLSKDAISDNDIIGAILLAKEKYHNSFSLTGPSDYKKRVMQLMLDNNIVVNFTNKDQEKMFAEMKIANANNNNSKDQVSKQDQQNSTLSGDPNMESENTNKKILAVRGAIRNDNSEYTQNVLLWKTENSNSLSGKIITPDGISHQVKADIVPRKDGKPNFLVIKVKHEDENKNSSYVDWGYANAVNSRKDSKSVYFDELIFNLQKLKEYDGLILKARVTDKVSDEFHKELGFSEQRKERPKRQQHNDDKNKADISADNEEKNKVDISADAENNDEPSNTKKRKPRKKN